MLNRFRWMLPCLCAALFVTLLPAQEKKRLVWPAPPQQARIEFLQSISTPADIGVEKSFFGTIWDWFTGADKQPNFLLKPLGIQVDVNGKIYVADPGSRCVHIFDRKEKEYSTLTDVDDEKLRSPVAVAVAEDGRIFVTDSERREVIVYDEDGDVKFVFRGYFQRPTGISLHRHRLYVVDTILNTVFVFDLEGKLLFTFGKRGTEKEEFNFPVFISASDHLFLTDAMNFRVQVLDDSGRCLRVFGKAGNVQGTFANPKGIAVDSDGNIYVADALFDAFQIFDGNGNLLLVVGTSGNRDGEFWMPEGMCIDEENKIYVVDAVNRRVQIFQYLRSSK